MEPVLRGLLRQQHKAEGNGGEEGCAEGDNALPVAAHQQNKPEYERGQFQATSDTDKYSTRHTGCRAQKIGKNQHHNDGVNLHKVEGTPPGPAEHYHYGKRGDRAVTPELILKR